LRGESRAHLQAKERLYNLVNVIGPKMIVKEYQYPNPFNPEYSWVFDLYAELWNNRKIAIEIDGKIGHSSKRSFEKRQAKTNYLASRGIELYAFPTKWVFSRKELPDSLFYDEMDLLQ
jgi:hypothetical protein